MYDMYPWDSRADGSRTQEVNAAPDACNASEAPADPATQAVQIALDLRDNGGASANAKPRGSGGTVPPGKVSAALAGRTRQ